MRSDSEVRTEVEKIYGSGSHDELCRQMAADNIAASCQLEKDKDGNRAMSQDRWCLVLAKRTLHRAMFPTAYKAPVTFQAVEMAQQLMIGAAQKCNIGVATSDPPDGWITSDTQWHALLESKERRKRPEIPPVVRLMCEKDGEDPEAYMDGIKRQCADHIAAGGTFAEFVRTKKLRKVGCIERWADREC